MNVGPGLPQRTQAQHNPLLVPAYSLIVAGPNSAGKSSLLRLLLDTAPLSPHASQSQLDSIARFLRAPPDLFPECELEIVWLGERVTLRLVDTPGLDFAPGADDDLERGLRDILHFVESRYIDGARDESTVGESHVHLCLYVLDPATIVPRAPYPYRRTSPSSPPAPPAPTTGLPPAEISAIRRLSSRVNVLPVLGRCDTVPLARLAELKRAVRRDLADAGLGFGIFDDDTTAPCVADDVRLPLLPYALFAPESFPAPSAAPAAIDDDDDARVAALHGRFTRRFRWGALDALDPRHSDFLALRRSTMLHHKVLKKYTKEYLYEKFKVDSLLAAQNPRHGRAHPGSVHALLNHREDRDVAEHDYTRPVSAGARTPAALSLSPLHHHANTTRLPPVVVPPYARDDKDRERHQEREREREREREQREREQRERDRDREREEALREREGHPDDSAPGRKRKITMACNFCRSRKLKCDGVRPACAQCVKRNNTCDYQPHAAGGASWRYKRGAAAAPYPPAPADEPRAPHEDVDELDDEASSASEAYTAPARKREVDMLIAATLDHAPPPAPPPAPWYDAAGAAGMGVLDVGSEGDKKKRLNRQSANYGSKAVACVHCRARKTRCDAARPACGNCARRALACSYVHTQPSQPRSKGKKAAAAAAAAAAKSASPPSSRAWPSPVPVDSALEESAERDRPRSPVAPPIATLDARGRVAGDGRAPQSQVQSHVKVPPRGQTHSPAPAREEATPQGTPERRSTTPSVLGAKRTRTVSPEVDAAAERGDKRAKWAGEGVVGVGVGVGVNVGAGAVGVRA